MAKGRIGFERRLGYGEFPESTKAIAQAFADAATLRGEGG